MYWMLSQWWNWEYKNKKYVFICKIKLVRSWMQKKEKEKEVRRIR